MNIDFYITDHWIYAKIFAVVKHPSSYYDLTTFHVLNLPRFAAFCLFCDKFNNFWAKYIVGKLRQIGAEYGILGGFSFMIKVLFVCHGNIWLWHRKTSIYAVCEDLEDDFSTKLALLAKNKGHWVHLEWKMKQKLNIKVICMREGSSSSFFCAKNKNIRLAWTNFRHEAK